MGGGKSAGKSRLSGKRQSDDRSAKRHKGAAPVQHGSIRQFLQQLPRAGSCSGGPGGAANSASRDSSVEPEGPEQLPSQTPAVPLLAPPAPPPSGAPTAAAGAKLQTALLRSLQHRFATQQALDTPAGWGGAPEGAEALQQDSPAGAAPMDQVQHSAGLDDEEDEEEGFQIFSQLAYEPTFLSQRPAETLGDLPGTDGGAGGGTSQLASQTQQALPCGSQPALAGARCGAGSWGAAAAAVAAEAGDDGADDMDWPAGSQQQLTQPQSQQQQGDDLQRRTSGLHGANVKTTPALLSSERVRCDGAGPSGLQMFPMFRRRDTLKKLYIVRHGESTYNAAVQRGSSWADPQIYDALLTDRGKQQARALRQQLAALNLPPDTLWVVSPLQRALQTLLLACPHAHLLGKGGNGSGGCSENSAAAHNGGADGSSGCKPPSVVVLQSITEKIVTCGDIGHPASDLRKQYPQLEDQLAALPELWWHSPRDKPNCAVRKCFGSSESKDQVMARIGAFRRWLQERPESVVVAVGHSSYWRTFEEVCRGTKPSHMRNCEYRLIHF